MTSRLKALNSAYIPDLGLRNSTLAVFVLKKVFKTIIFIHIGIALKSCILHDNNKRLFSPWMANIGLVLAEYCPPEYVPFSGPERCVLHEFEILTVVNVFDSTASSELV